MSQERFATLQWLIGAALFAWLVHLLAPILLPFVAAAILAYLCAPWVDWLCVRKVRRAPAVLLIMLLLLGLILLLLLILLPLFQREIWSLIFRLPSLLETLRLKLAPFFQQYLHINLQWDSAALRDMLGGNLQGAGDVAGKVLPWVSGGTAALLGLLMNLVLLPLVLFYLLRDWPVLLARLEELIPRHWHGKAMKIIGESDGVLGEFLRGQLIVMLVMSVWYSLGLEFSGLQFAVPIGVVAGMLVFVPYVGVLTGLALATLEAAAQFDNFGGVLLVWAVFGAGHLLESLLITPHFVGERVGLHPLVVIFALLAFGQLFGFFGVLLALPMAAVLMVGLRHAKEWYLGSSLYTG
jgi:predicted PurR-regulated permease PerM